jgi:hypothetical protein
MAKDRSNTGYWKRRLKTEHPRIHADLEAGRIPSINEARRKAGLLKPVSRLQALEREWHKASIKEREDFKAWAGLVSPSTSAPGTARFTTLTDASGYLLPAVAGRAIEIQKKRGLKSGEIMRELGFKPLSVNWGRAVSLGWKPSPAFLASLETWLNKHSSL